MGIRVLSVIFLFLNQVLGQIPPTPIEKDDNPYRHVAILDPEGFYRLEWLVDMNKEKIHFNVTVKTLGFVLLGLNRKSEVSGADIVIGGVDSTGQVYFSDRHGISNELIPATDWKQDWIFHSAWESETHTSLSFSRSFDTCDELQDIVINDDSLYLHWIYGNTDDLTDYHGANRGIVPRYLLDPDITPRVVHATLRNENSAVENSPALSSDVKIWSLKNTFKLPPKRTTYWCRIHKLSLPKKHHIIGLTLQINNETQQNMHHMLVYRCKAPNAEALFERFVNHPGEECYSIADHEGEIPIHSCVELKVGLPIGGLPFFFPDELGLPIGHTGPNEYYLQQTHYDNPDSRDDLVSVNQLDAYYTPILRPNDGGVLSQGHHIPGSPSILLPPGSMDHTILGHCGPTCTQKMLPPEGIKIIAATLHSHNAGRKLLLQHFRNGVELAPISQDENYVFNFQPVRLLRQEVTVLPGDHLVMKCVYDTTESNKTIVGGYPTDQEMCKTFLVYYNLLEDFSVCRSEIISTVYNDRYLAGARNLTWDEPTLEFKPLAPPYITGMTVSEISDSVYVDWSAERRALLQRDHLFFPQLDICPSHAETEELRRTGNAPLPSYVSYPIVPYQQVQAHRQCHLRYGK